MSEPTKDPFGCWMDEKGNLHCPPGVLPQSDAKKNKPRSLLQRKVSQHDEPLPGAGSTAKAWIGALAPSFMVGGAVTALGYEVRGYVRWF